MRAAILTQLSIKNISLLYLLLVVSIAMRCGF